MTRFRSGNGAAWLDLLSTREGRWEPTRRADAIDSPSSLREWLCANDLEPIEAVTGADVELFEITREALHRTTVNALRDEPPAPGDAHIIAAALTADRGVRIERAKTGLRLRRPQTAKEALARLARDAVEDLAGPHRTQLRACGDDTCAGVFLDPTGRRRWCTDQSCGNRLRVRAYRARAQRPS